MTFPITHDTLAHRFEIHVDGQVCALDYDLAKACMTITHTRVPNVLSGQGLAGSLVREALETARERGWKVIPACSYARHFIDRHPEYRTLLASNA